MSLVSRIPSLHLERSALYNSMPDLLNVLVVISLCWFVFAIFGVRLYKGKMGYCEEPMEFHVSKHKCLEEGKTWIVSGSNFENIFEAMSSLFVIASFDAWNELYFVCLNSNYQEYVKILMILGS
jgi:Ion transport protein